MQTQNEQIYNKMEDKQPCINKTQKAGKPEKCNVNILNSNSKDNPTVIDNNNSKSNYFIPDSQQGVDKVENAEIRKKHT